MTSITRMDDEDIFPGIASKAPELSLSSFAPLKECHFLRMSPELRNMVYDSLLVVDKLFPNPTPEDDRRYESWKSYPRPHMEILGTCHSIKAEAELLLYSCNTFVLPSGPLPVGAPNALHFLPFSALPHLRRLSIAYTMYDRSVSLIKNSIISTFCGNAAHSYEDVERFNSVATARRQTDLHGIHAFSLVTTWNRMLVTLPQRLDFLEIDLTYAYCYFNCCRQVREVSHCAQNMWRNGSVEAPPKVVRVFEALDGELDAVAARFGVYWFVENPASCTPTKIFLDPLPSDPDTGFRQLSPEVCLKQQAL